MRSPRCLKISGWVLSLIVLAQVRPLDAATDQRRAEELFALKVKPLLAEKCLACHGSDPEKIKGGLNLSTREGMLRGGDTSSRVVVPGRADESVIMAAIRWASSDLEMPPKENDRLTEEQIECVRQWIDGGAPWPDEATVAEIRERLGDGVTVTTSGGLSEEWDQRSYDPANLWAYQPVERRDPPTAFGDHPIDAFINRALDEDELKPAPLATRRELIRRAAFDLTGLPPSPSEVDDFLNDPSSDSEAFERAIDRLLASTHYGEQMGRHWLDVTRYADSSGFANDYDRGNAWRYRDYVVRAFNADKPFDQFIREQIAGDEMNPDDPEMLVAAGFLRMGPWELTGMEVAKIARQRFLDDVTDIVGQAFLSHPFQCARCHDHKFDPIPARDYYRLQAVFATTQLAERKAPFLPGENVDGFEERQYLLERRRRFQSILAELNKKEEAAARQWCEERGLPYIPRNEGLKKGVSEDQLPPKNVGFSVEDFGMERIARKGMERLRWELERYEPYALSVYSGRSGNARAVYAPVRMPEDPLESGELEQTAILSGGDPFSPVEEVSPGALSAVAFGGGTTFPDSVVGRRSALAEWIANDANPLTARSIVNRIWQWHFGQGIAPNPNNFGAMGGKPSHPELLDWLAAEFVKSGWSVKGMHRLIMTSEAYRRSTRHPDRARLDELDPHARSYAVFQPRRLSAEELRDTMLAVSGELNRSLGGIPSRPEINGEAALQPRMVMGTFAPSWQPSTNPEQRHRRSIYTLQLRGLALPMMEAFNAPNSDASCEARESSMVTPQVFALFNSRNSYDRAAAFAKRLAGEGRSRVEIVERAFELAYGRPPDVEEMAKCLAHWERMTERHGENAIRPPEFPSEIEREALEENTGESFAFVEKLEFHRGFVPDTHLSELPVEQRGLAELCLVLFNSNEFIYVY